MPGFDPVIYWNPVLEYEQNSDTIIDFYFNDLIVELPRGSNVIDFAF